MNYDYDKVYIEFLNSILSNDKIVTDRTGVGTFSNYNVFVDYGVISLDAFPILTSKLVSFNSVLSELLWFIEGSTNERRLAEITFNKPREEIVDKKTIWTGNAQADYWGNPELGNIYGKMWRSTPYPVIQKQDVHGVIFNNVDIKYYDQLQSVIEQIKHNPFSRRHVVSSWFPAIQTQEQAALPPCHHSFQFTVQPTDDKHSLNLLVSLRSNDAFLGHPFNLTSYALLQAMVAHICGYSLGRLSFIIGDAHIYTNHLEAVYENIRRVQTELRSPYPKLIIDDSVKHIDDFTKESFTLVDYNPLSKISAPMAV